MAKSIDLRAFPGDSLVIQFGGRPRQVNAYTFANALISMSEVMRQINAQINPNHKIEVVIDAVGPGSFRSRVRTISTRVPGLLRSTFKDVVFPVFLGVLLNRYVFTENINIIVQDDSYIIESPSGDRVILPKEAYSELRKIKRTPDLERNVSSTFEVLESDESVESLSFHREMNEREPLVVFPRSDFGRLSEVPEIARVAEGQRVRHERCELVVIRAILKRTKRKWQFVYQGFEISAAVTDPKFYDRMEAHELAFYEGSVLDATLRIVQTLDEETGAYLNDPTGYEVTEVHAGPAGWRQGTLLPYN